MVITLSTGDEGMYINVDQAHARDFHHGLVLNFGNYDLRAHYPKGLIYYE